MKKRVYSRPVCVTLSETMFNQLEVITREREISLSEYIREAVQEKFDRNNEPNNFYNEHQS